MEKTNKTIQLLNHFGVNSTEQLKDNEDFKQIILDFSKEYKIKFTGYSVSEGNVHLTSNDKGIRVTFHEEGYDITSVWTIHNSLIE